MEAAINPSEEAMLEDPLEVVTDSVKEIIPEEAPKDPLVTTVTDPEEADTT